MYMLFFFQYRLSVRYVFLRPFNLHSQELTVKRVGERKFVWSNQTNFQMFIYLLMHAFGVIVFFIWFLYAAIDGSKFRIPTILPSPRLLRIVLCQHQGDGNLV